VSLLDVPNLPDNSLLNQFSPGKDVIVEAVRKNDSIVIIGEPGSGKTTRLSPHVGTNEPCTDCPLEVPQCLRDAGLVSPTCRIAVTQPRKVAATTIAARVAMERGVEVGTEVGYAIRFEDASSFKTRIKFYTDGMLLREMLNDPQLNKCEVVIVDEAHERTLRTDVLLANLKRIQKDRNGSSEAPKGKKGKEKAIKRPLKIIVMSASLQADRFSKYMDGSVAL